MRIQTRTICVAVGLVMVAATAFGGSTTDGTTGEPVTFYKDVLPILQDNCQTCHRPGGTNLGGMVAPMAFTTYQEVRPWAKSIARAVSTKSMPPWHASEEFHGVFANERTLSPQLINRLVRWARTGAAAGNPADAPEPRPFPDVQWAIGEPDLVLDMGETFLVEDDVEDLYVNFTVDMGLEEDRWVQALEFKPGSSAVHHIIGYAINEGDSYRDGRRGMIGGIAPGNDPEVFPDGHGFLIDANSKLVFAMHYHKESGPGTGVPDRSSVGIKFYPKGVTPKQIHIEPIGNGQFEIPPRHANWEVGSARIYDRPIEIIYLMPHMHLRGKAARYEAFYPDGTRETLLDVPAYDFNWQTSYEYHEPKIIPAGTRLEIKMWFDNTDERAAEANFNSQRPVRFGGPTTDEMDLGWLSYSYLDEEPVSEEIPSAGR